MLPSAVEIADRLERGEELVLSSRKSAGRGELMQEVAAELSRRGHLLSVVYPSDCGHSQYGPTQAEIDGCPEIIGRRCPHCQAEVYWRVDHWAAL